MSQQTDTLRAVRAYPAISFKPRLTTDVSRSGGDRKRHPSLLSWLALTGLFFVAVPADAAPEVKWLQPDAALLAGLKKISLPRAPAWVKVNQVPVWSVQEIGLQLRQITAKAPEISYTRSSFVRPDHKWLVAYDSWFRKLMRSQRIDYAEQVWDCDNYARSFVAFADLLALQAGETRGSICVGWVTVYNEVAFANIPAGGAHALVIAGTDKGIFVIEPQNGTMVALEKYPNRDSLVELNF